MSNKKVNNDSDKKTDTIGKKKFSFDKWGELLALFISTYLFTAVIMSVVSDVNPEKLEYVNSTNGVIMLLVGIIVFVFVFAASGGLYYKKIVYLFVLISSALFGFVTIAKLPQNFYLTACVVLITCFFIYWVFDKSGIDIAGIKISYKTAFITAFVVFVVFTVIFARQTVYRNKSFSASCFDLGIFAQMFRNMARCGRMITTCERNELLSHLRVHFSPVFYLILPFYMLHKSGNTLLVLQAISVFSGIIPLCLIAKNKKVAPALLVVIALLYAFTPAFAGGIFYDFHENRFLPPLLLWFLYFLETDRKKLSLLFLFLVLSVKEDAGLYTFFIAIYYIAERKSYKLGSAILGITVVWFAAVMIFESKFGSTDFMDMRYGIYLTGDQKSLACMAANVLKNPYFLLKNVFAEDCVSFIICTMGALLFVPVATKKFNTLWLLVPYVVINLMSNYGFQHNLGYQYAYGSSTILLYMFVLNISELDVKWQNMLTIGAMWASLLFMQSQIRDKWFYYEKYYKNNSAKFELMSAKLAEIDEDTSVTSYTFYVPHLEHIKELYLLKDKKPETDIVIVPKNSKGGECKSFVDKHAEYGYALVSDRSACDFDIYKKIEK